MKYLSLFTGIGGFELGIGQKGDCIGFSEVDKYATLIYKKHFPNHYAFGDITKINADELPDFDFLCGGFPCQAFSIAGKRRGFEDTRGTLFFDIARILKAKQPRLLLLENVKGLLSHDNGNTFKTIISTLTELGYDLQWQVLNSKNFGVPQNRERVFIVGHLRGTPRPKVFPFRESDLKTYSEPEIVGSTNNAGRGERARVYSTEGGVTTLTATDYKQPKQILQLNNPTHSNDRVYGEDGISPTLNTMQGGNRQPKVLEEMKIRRLTPTECERLQGFPDGWTEKGICEIISLDILLTEQLCQNVESKTAKETLLLGANNFALNIISVGKNGETQIYSTLIKERIPGTASCVADLLIAENSVCDITSLGNDTETLLHLNETLEVVEITKKSNILEKMAEKSISQLWKIELEENLSKEKLSTILIWIKEIIKTQTFICAKTEKPITDAIIVYKKLEQSYLKGELLNLKTGNIIQISDTQRYKTLGNAVTVNVIQAIVEKLI